MSYARFTVDSDVYVFLSAAGVLECCSCCLAQDGEWETVATSTEQMLEHLHAHLAAGDLVPDYTFTGLARDAGINDHFINTGVYLPDVTLELP